MTKRMIITIHPVSYTHLDVYKRQPTHSLAMNMFKAFILGGIICCLGQLIMNVLKGQFGVDASEAPVWCSMILVLISCILTSINLYAPLANWGGDVYKRQ